MLANNQFDNAQCVNNQSVNEYGLIKQTQQQKLWAGVALLVGSIVLLYLLQPSFFLVTDKIEASITNANSGMLILAAGLYALVKTTGLLPLLIGCFMISNAVCSMLPGGERNRVQGFFVDLAVMISGYFLALIITGYHPDWFVPIIVATFAHFVAPPNETRLWLVQRSVTTAQLLLGCFWLDTAPALGRFGIGNDEIAVSIKLAAGFLDSTPIMDFISLSFFVPLLVIALITSILINNHYQQLKHMERDKQRDNEVQQYRLQLVQARSLQEMHSLVHDLKTPLTTINGLCSLLEMKYASDNGDKQYFQRIDRSVQNMNEMISEMLYDTTKRELPLSDLFNFIRAQLVPEELKQEISFILDNPNAMIKANRVRLARAIVNLLENALEATNGMSRGRIEILTKGNGGKTYIAITDNGVGIPGENLDRIWTSGYSTKTSSGLGLSFVKQVIEDHDGEITISSIAGAGTTFTIILPGENNWRREKI